MTHKQERADAALQPDMAARIVVERVDLVYRNTVFAQIMLVFLVALVYAVLAGQPGTDLLGVWLAGMVAVAGARVGLAWRHRRDPEAAGRVGHWYRLALVGTVAAGCGWALLSLLFFSGLEPGYLYLASLILAGVVAGALPVLSSDLRLYVLYAVLVLVPLMATLVLLGGQIQLLFALAALLFLLTLLRSASYLNQTIVQNLRERFAKEAALEESRAANAKLRAEIEQRKRIEADLVSARDAAEAASRAKSEFLANASHEFRTPMNGIIGMTSLALDTQLDERQRQYLEMVMQSADEMMAMLTRLLEYARVGAKAVQVTLARVQPAALVEQAVRLAEPAAREKGLALTLECAPDLPAEAGFDPEPIGHVLDQLIDNALKFTQAGAIRVRLEPARDRAGWLRLSVSDTGLGIAADKQAVIFEAFTQADGSSTRAHGGLGLGLALCAELARLVGGELRVDSEPGRGSTFEFLFPYEE